MPYTMRKTPRSSFMLGDVTGTIASPIAIVAPTPPVATDTGLGRYVLWGGLAYLAYWLLSKE